MEIHAIGPKNQSPDKNYWDNMNKKLYALAVFGALGGISAFTYNQVGGEHGKAEAVVLDEVRYVFWTGQPKNTPHNVLTMKIVDGPRKGERGDAYFYFKSSAEQFKKGDHVSVSYHKKPLTGHVIMSDVSPKRKMKP